MEDRTTDANQNKSSSRSNVDESHENKQGGDNIQALVNYIGKIESGQDADSTISQHDTSSVILNRIKLWPPQANTFKSTSSAANDDSQINAGAYNSAMSGLNSINEESSLAAQPLPSFGGGNPSTFNNQINDLFDNFT